MAWIAENRRTATDHTTDQPLLTEPMKALLQQTYFPRYPTKRAVLLPALHLVQHQYGHIPPRALEELGAFLELSPAEVLDTASFYEEYWLKPKGKYLIGVCRSLACEICGSSGLAQHLKRKLGIDAGQTTPDGRFTLVELECLGSCGTAPAALVNQVLHENLTGETLERVLDALPDNPDDYRDPTMTWEESKGH